MSHYFCFIIDTVLLLYRHYKGSMKMVDPSVKFWSPDWRIIIDEIVSGNFNCWIARTSFPLSRFFLMFITTFVHPLWPSVVLLLLTASTFLLPRLLWALKRYSKAALYTAECLEIGINRRGRQVWQHSTMQSISKHTCCSLSKNHWSTVSPCTPSKPGLWGEAFTSMLLFIPLKKKKLEENHQTLMNIHPKKESNLTKCRCST